MNCPFMNGNPCTGSDCAMWSYYYDGCGIVELKHNIAELNCSMQSLERTMRER